MQQEIQLQLTPAEASQEYSIKTAIALHLGRNPSAITGFRILKKSIDARRRNVLFTLKVNAYIDEPYTESSYPQVNFPALKPDAERVIIVGAGPAGLFAALELIEKGIKPVILERGKNVRDRRRDLAALNREGILDDDSNYCFGEGGAGTYSDGKLYTRSNKRGNIDKILQLFVQFGADPSILYTAHPHIGTNKLPGIIQAMREQIMASGGEVHFQERVTDFQLENNRIKAVITANGNRFEGLSVILATGHSAKDIFVLLAQKNILIEPKPFAMGVRIEHPQTLIDSIQYHCPLNTTRDPHLPPAAYQLVEQVRGRGAFSFCMCPGGIIATASTSQEALVVNGWSPSKRNNTFANSGMVVQVEQTDLKKMASPLAMHDFQESVERKAYEAGGGRFVAPAQRMTDFVMNRSSSSLPENSYLRGVNPVNLHEVLPGFISATLRDAFKQFGKKMKGYLTEEAILIAPESRTSSPVRIPRDPETLRHPQIQNLFPCAEGAGYAGGIVSAAMDGQKVSNHLSFSYKSV